MGTVTITGNPYPIYGTAAAADIYLAAKIGAASWSGATADDRARALVSSTVMIKAYLDGRGYETDPETNADAELAQANYELAFAFILNPSLADTVLSGSAVEKRIKAGPAEVEYAVSASALNKSHGFPQLVWALLAGWMAGQSNSASAIGVGLASGTCETSTLIRNSSQPYGGCD
jgi:hypothetical protein